MPLEPSNFIKQLELESLKDGYPDISIAEVVDSYANAENLKRINAWKGMAGNESFSSDQLPISNNFLGEFFPEAIETFIDNSKKKIPDFKSLNLYKFSELFQEGSGESPWYQLKEDVIEREKLFTPDVEKEVKYKGIYGFFEVGNSQQQAVYFGISKNIFKRIKQHIFGKSHYEASLVYLQCLDEYNRNNKDEYSGTRDQFPNFSERRRVFQEKMISSWKILVLPLQNEFEIYFLEFYLACKYKAKWNSFRTH